MPRQSCDRFLRGRRGEWGPEEQGVIVGTGNEQLGRSAQEGIVSSFCELLRLGN